jgi:putative tryptophan/tyrosine transport system substrate-binding protein
MRRREVILLLGSAAALWPPASHAQQPAMPVIGFLGSGSDEQRRGDAFPGFYRGLADIGYVEGRNVAIDYRWAEDHYDRLAALAEELVRRQVAVIVAPGSVAAASAAKAATSTIPIVFMIASDPIELGLVKSLSRPDGNLTGVAYLNIEVAPKRLELLHELMPAATSVALLVNPANPIEAEVQTRELQGAAHAFGLRLLVLNASSPAEIEAAFATLVRERADALQIGVDPLFGRYRNEIVALAARHAVPTMYPWREFTVAGGLMNYGAVISSALRQVGVYTGRIVKGEKPADLPVQRPTELRFVLNLKTAKALGIDVPPKLLALADEVIE